MTHKVILASDFARQRACELVQKAPQGWTVTLAEPKRTTDQNSKFYAMLTDVSVSLPGGRKLKPEHWKSLFMDALASESGNPSFGTRWEPGLDGEGVVNLGHRSSKLTVAEMADLITFIQAWGDQNGVTWTDPERKEAA